MIACALFIFCLLNNFLPVTQTIAEIIFFILVMSPLFKLMKYYFLVSSRNIDTWKVQTLIRPGFPQPYRPLHYYIGLQMNDLPIVPIALIFTQRPIVLLCYNHQFLNCLRLAFIGNKHVRTAVAVHFQMLLYQHCCDFDINLLVVLVLTQRINKVQLILTDGISSNKYLLRPIHQIGIY